MFFNTKKRYSEGNIYLLGGIYEHINIYQTDLLKLLLP